MRVDLETLLTDSWLKKNRLAPLSNVPTEKGWNYKFKEKERGIQCKTFSRTSCTIIFSIFFIEKSIIYTSYKISSNFDFDLEQCWFLTFWHFFSCYFPAMNARCGESRHLKTITIISPVSLTIAFNLFVFVRESCCIFICICVCIFHILEWSGGRERLSSPLMFAINFKSVLQFPSRSRFQFLQTLQPANLEERKIFGNLISNL